MIRLAAVYAAYPMLSLGMLLAFWRLVRGPSLADRVVAMDLLMLLGMGLVTVHAVLYQEPVLIDVAIVTALLAFLSTVAFARYLERRAKP